MNRNDYYDQKLSAERLRKCYEVAPPRVKQYLQAEIDFVLSHARKTDRLLELGCGYGRALDFFAKKAGFLAGIDTSVGSLELARKNRKSAQACFLAAMDAGNLAFGAGTFDVVVCIQNGISAFKVDRRRLVEESVRITRSGGRVLFSSYAGGFWEERLEWFRIQADHGLLGEIDERATGSGVIVCKDGFRAETVGPEEFLDLTRDLEADSSLTEVDGSSLFCVLIVR